MTQRTKDLLFFLCFAVVLFTLLCMASVTATGYIDQQSESDTLPADFEIPYVHSVRDSVHEPAETPPLTEQ